MLNFHNCLTDDEKTIVSCWKYDGEYAIYNLPPQDKQKKEQKGIYNPDNQYNYYAFYDGDAFVGYINLIERQNKFSVGIAVAPDKCGRGYGTQMLNICAEIAEDINPSKTLGLQVRCWNSRAIRCYTKAGFKIIGEKYTMVTPSGEAEFYRMIKNI